MHRAPELRRDSDHNAHVDHENRGFDDCYPVMAHAETEAEAREIAQLLCDKFDFEDELPDGKQEGDADA